jgi:type IV pilus assembly protein PilV
VGAIVPLKNPQTRFASEAAPSAQRGATLIEILVTLFVTALALVGIVAMQLSTVRYQQSAMNAQRAVGEASFMAERIRLNAQALVANLYLSDTSYADAAILPTAPTCGSVVTPCTTANTVNLDIWEWKTNLARNASLPGGRGAIAPVVTGGNTDLAARQIIIMWQQKPDNDANADDSGGTPALPLDPNCPATQRLAGIRCYTLVVSP